MPVPGCAESGDAESADEGDRPLCNLYSVTKGQQAIREFTSAMRDRTSNLPLLPGVFPDYAAPRGSRADDCAVGHALARLCAEGQGIRSRRHQCPQRRIPALAALARNREPLRRAFHEFFRKRSAAVGAGFGVGVPVVVSIATAGIGQGIFRIEPNCLVVRQSGGHGAVRPQSDSGASYKSPSQRYASL
jgi:hypothetical protein